MPAFLTSKDIGSDLQVSDDTARRIMRKMEHLERPLRVRSETYQKWLYESMVRPGESSGPVPIRSDKGREFKWAKRLR